MAKKKDQEPKKPEAQSQDQFDQEMDELVDVTMDQIEKEEKSLQANLPAPSQKQTGVVKFQKFQKGTQLVEHHLFKLAVAKMKKNISWKYRQPETVEIEHVHFYHSVNDTTLQKNRFCSPVGGHFHEIILDINENGDIVGAKCGPAVHYATKKVGGGNTVRRLERIKWERYDDRPQEIAEENEFEVDQLTPIQNSVPLIVEADMHTHELEYMGTEEFSAHSKSEKRKEETAKVKGLMAGQPLSTQPGKMADLTNQKDSAAMQAILKEGDGKQAST